MVVFIIVKSLEFLLDKLDLILVMTVNPGFGGQKFIQTSHDKARRLLSIIEENGLKVGNNLEDGFVAVEMDGGIYPGEISQSVIESGVNVLVAGSAVYGSENIAKAIEELKYERAN